MIYFTLYSRSYCHLCDDMLAALHKMGQGHQYAVDVVDVDLCPGLVAKYDELVPVLFGKKDHTEPIELCHYFLDSAKLSAFFEDT